MLKLVGKSLVVFALILVAISVAHASTIYTESVNGELSNSGLSPTLISVSLGSNIISGTTGGSTAPDVRDYFTINVPANLQIFAVIELAGTQAGNVGFLGLQSGPQVTIPTNAVTATGLLGWIHYAPTATDINILPTMAIAANGSSGFTPPLGPGSYAFWLQDSSPGTFAYSFDVQLSPVPETPAVVLTLVGLFSLVLVLRRRTVCRAETTN